MGDADGQLCAAGDVTQRIERRLGDFLPVCIAVYPALMLRRVYAASRWYCAAVALVISWSFFHIVWFYRFLLLLITLRTM